MESPYLPSPWPWLIWVLPAAFGVVALLLGRWRALWAGGVALVGLVLTVLVSLQIALEVYGRGRILTAWNMNLYVDGLSALMELLGSLMGVLVVLFSFRFLPERLRQQSQPPERLATYYGWLLVFLGMMNWTCATNNLVILYVSLELTTLATAFLVIFYGRRESLEAGYKYLMLVTVGVLFALLGISLLYAAVAGMPGPPERRFLLLTLLSRYATVIPPSVVLLSVALLMVGFGTKAGLVPFHAWLPDAHAEAPAPISALLSGIVIKVGAYALARVLTIFAPHYPAVVVFVAIMASVSMVVGILMALVQDDLKRMLAYSSVSQMGYVVEGLGLGSYLGVYGGLFHLVNHTLIKALLFLGAGSVIHLTGRRRISELGGLAHRAPLTAFCFFVGALAIGGLPPFSAFMSKITLFLAAAEQGLLWAALIALFTGLLTVACFVRAAYRIFWGKAPAPMAEPAYAGAADEEEALSREVPPSMWVSMLILALIVVALGLCPTLLHPMLDRSVQCVLEMFGAP